jgi:hypothetical protein
VKLLGATAAALPPVPMLTTSNSPGWMAASCARGVIVARSSLRLRVPTRGEYDNLQQVLLYRNIGISWGSTTPGAQAFLGSPDGRVNQDWEVRQKPGGVYELVNRGSGLCLGINNASTQPGAHAVQFPCDGFQNQRWRMVPW